MIKWSIILLFFKHEDSKNDKFKYSKAIIEIEWYEFIIIIMINEKSKKKEIILKLYADELQKS